MQLNHKAWGLLRLHVGMLTVGPVFGGLVYDGTLATL